MPPDLAGYVTDVPYVAGFKPMLAPAWLDLVAVLGGTRPPARDSGFAWCDLGCGHGVTAVILAATHPGGRFCGIDAMPVHIEHARKLARMAGVGNARFDVADFASAVELPLPGFDYIVAHGVYNWIGADPRAALRCLIDRRLKPGGLVYLSYNALPGWTGDLPFQYLVRALAAQEHGNSAARLAAASRLIHALADNGAAALAASHTVSELRRHPDDYRPGYLVHEFLHEGWQPLYVTEARAELREIGLKPVGTAILIENFDRWILGRRARALVAGIADPDLRELVRDFCIDQRFRCDVFVREGPRIDEAEQRRRLLTTGLALARPPGAVTYRVPTPSGELDYDNPVARRIVAALATGARSLAEMPDTADLIANALALCAAGDVRPVETTRAPVNRLNQALQKRLGEADEIPLVALSCGTALECDRSLVDWASERNGEWRDFLALHGA